MIEKILQIFSTKDLKNFKRNRMFILKFSKNSNIVSYSINYVSDFNAFTMSHIVEARYTISNIYIVKTQHACHV